MIKKIRRINPKIQPDIALVYGDTNSTLVGAVVCQS